MTTVVLSEAVKSTLCVWRGVHCMQHNAFREAIAHLNEALEHNPADPVAHWNKATSLLSLGDYSEGFKECEWRWQMYDWRWGLLGDDIDLVRQLPKWNGESLADKHLLFYWEMGYGDAIQQLRYVPILKQLARKVTVLMAPP